MTKKDSILISVVLFIFAMALTYWLNTEHLLISEGDGYLSQNLPAKAVEKYALAASIYPFSPTPHQKLSEVFANANDWEKAKKEILIATDLSKNSQELQSILLRIESEIAKPDHLRVQIAYWENVAQEKPDYRDAWLQLSALYYQNYQGDKAKEALAKAEQIDPNNETIGKLKQLYNQR